MNIQQETTYIGGALCRVYSSDNGRVATISPAIGGFNVWGYSNGGTFADGENDFHEFRESTNASNEIAIAYVKGAIGSFSEPCEECGSVMTWDEATEWSHENTPNASECFTAIRWGVK